MCDWTSSHWVSGANFCAQTGNDSLSKDMWESPKLIRRRIHGLIIEISECSGVADLVQERLERIGGGEGQMSDSVCNESCNLGDLLSFKSRNIQTAAQTGEGSAADESKLWGDWQRPGKTATQQFLKGESLFNSTISYNEAK